MAEVTIGLFQLVVILALAANETFGCERFREALLRSPSTINLKVVPVTKKMC
jgi:hypothetical protein